MNLQEVEKRLIFKVIAGSHAYGTATEHSDIDYRGIFSVPGSDYLRLNKKVEQVSDSTNDTTYYALYRFLQLACGGNPNIIELLWMPEDCVKQYSDEWEHVLKIRDTFITKSVLDSFGGYAVSQIKKARGQNKLVNNPVPEAKPCKEDFCWVVRFCTEPKENHYCYFQDLDWDEYSPFRPKKLSEIKWMELKNYNCCAVEHAVNCYRLYHYGVAAHGVFRGDETADIVPVSIPKADECLFAGVLIDHQDAYEKALNKWHEYWDWRKNRNEARWKAQDGKENPVDWKNIGHCIRLLYSAENILKNGEPIVRFDGEALQRLKDIRAGKLPYEEILQEAEGLLAKLDEVRKTCSLPSSPDYDKVNALSIKLHKY